MPIEKEKSPVFNLTLMINGENHKKRTTDIAKTIMELKPDFCYTDTYITLSTGSGKNKITTERKLNLLQSKKLFNNENVLQVYVMNLLQEYA